MKEKRKRKNISGAHDGEEYEKCFYNYFSSHRVLRNVNDQYLRLQVSYHFVRYLHFVSKIHKKKIFQKLQSIVTLF